MYVVPPPQRSDSGSNGDLRVYQTWKGSNVSFWIFLSWGFFLTHLMVFVFLELVSFLVVAKPILISYVPIST